MEESLHFSTVHRSLNLPSSLMGAERELMMLTILMAGVLVFLGQTWVTFFIGVIFYFGLSFALKLVFKADPVMSKVFMSQLHQQKAYVHKSTHFAGLPK